MAGQAVHFNADLADWLGLVTTSTTEQLPMFSFVTVGEELVLSLTVGRPATPLPLARPPHNLPDPDLDSPVPSPTDPPSDNI